MRCDAENRLDESRFTTAVGTDDSYEFTLVDVEVDIVENLHRAVSTVEALDLENAFAHSSSPPSSDSSPTAPRYASITARLLRTSSGVPTMRISPSFMTTIRSTP